MQDNNSCTNVAGSVYQGLGTSCNPNPCVASPATGACNTAIGCEISTQANCNALPGIYNGDNTTCPPAVGACCYPIPLASGGDCLNLTEQQCLNSPNQTGVHFISGSTCLPDANGVNNMCP